MNKNVSLVKSKEAAEIPEKESLKFQGDIPEEALRSGGRLPGEHVKAFAAFCIYRDMGVDRSISKVAKIIKKSLSMANWYSKNWRWKERVIAYQEEMDRQKRIAYQKEIEEMGRRHARQSLIYQRVISIPAEALVAKMKDPIEMEKFKNIDIEKLYEKVIRGAYAFKDMVDIERKSRGEPGEIIKQDITSDGEKINNIHVILPMANKNEENI